MVLVVEKFDDFASIASKYLVRAYVFFQEEDEGDAAYFKIVCGRVGYEGRVKKDSEEYKKIKDWLTRAQAVKVKQSIPEDLFFA